MLYNLVLVAATAIFAHITLKASATRPIRIRKQTTMGNLDMKNRTKIH